MTAGNSSRRDKKTFQKRTPPGALPGTLVDRHADPVTRVRVFRYSAHSFEEQESPVAADLPAMRSPEHVVWVDVEGVGNAQLIQEIGSGFGLHPLALEDVLHVHQRAKVEEYADILYIVVRMHLGETDQKLETEQVSLFLGPGWVITFQDQADDGDSFDTTRTRLREGRGRIRHMGADYLVYSLIDSLIDDYFPVVEQYAAQLDEFEEVLIAHPRRSPMQRLHAMRSNLRELRRILWPHREAINALMRDRCHLIQPETQIFLRDCYDHLVQLIDVTESLRESCTDLRELHLSELSQRSNDVMQVLTVIAVMFMPMTFVAGLYGMNFDPGASPLNMPELRWYFGYPFALGLMGMLEMGLLYFLWRRGWLSRKKP